MLCRSDIEQAFVQSELNEDLFMKLPPGCGSFSGKIVRSNNDLYSLRQACRQWHGHLTQRLISRAI